MSEIIKMLMTRTGLNEFDIGQIISNAPRRYKDYFIAKRSGGERLISQPALEVKLLQRVLVEEVIEKLPVHDAATAYRKGLSIKHNAFQHSSSGPILKLDFNEFFPSIRSEDWANYCREREIFLSEQDIAISSNILFKRKKGSSFLNLAIGAPSSPALSNVIMFEFDKRVFDAVSGEQIIYTRYADDLTFSAPRTGFLNVVEPRLRRIMKEISYPRLQLNEKKTVYATKKYKRRITGLIITNDGDVSVGYDRKRNIRSAVYHAKLGKLDIAETRKLAGDLAFIKSVEPEFIDKLAQKYGWETIIHIKRLGRRKPKQAPMID